LSPSHPWCLLCEFLRYSFQILQPNTSLGIFRASLDRIRLFR